MKFGRVPLEQFYRSYAIGSFSVAKDESQIAFSTNLSGSYDVWSISPTHPYPSQLTTQGQVPASIEISPTGDFIVVAFDHDGDENAQLYAIPPHGGALLPLRQATGRRFMGAQLSEDGAYLYYTSDKDVHQHLAGYAYDIERGEERVLYKGDRGATYLYAVAKDGSSFVTVVHLANTHALGYVHRGDHTTSLTPDDSVVQVVTDMKYAGNTIYFCTNYGAERSYLAKHDIKTGAFEEVYAVDGADVDHVEIDEELGMAILTVSGSVEDWLVELELSTGATKTLDAPFKNIRQVHLAKSGNLYVLGLSDTEPTNIYLRRHGEEQWTALTDNRIPGVTKADLSPAKIVSYPSFDGLVIEALLFSANPETANGYTVVWPHGGPQSSERRFYRAFFQYLTYAGYQVFAPNFRGSAGYGSEFIKMVEGDWGHGPRLDMVEGIEWLIKSGHTERGKLFLVGGSYGGYMTLLLHGRHAEYFRACVDIFGVSNLFTFIESVPDHWKPMMKQWLGDPVEDKERLTKDSPITYLAGMTKPMLVIQGANDPRVVKAESDQIVEALRKQGTEIEYLVFDDEGHGFSKKTNEIEAYGRTVAFLDKHRD